MPRLYRYKFDPSAGIQLAMGNIWSAVVPESKKAVDCYFKEIMEDLLHNLNSSLWRNRQSRCTHGLVDLCTLGARLVDLETGLVDLCTVETGLVDLCTLEAGLVDLCTLGARLVDLEAGLVDLCTLVELLYVCVCVCACVYVCVCVCTPAAWL